MNADIFEGTVTVKVTDRLGSYLGADRLVVVHLPRGRPSAAVRAYGLTPTTFMGFKDETVHGVANLYAVPKRRGHWYVVLMTFDPQALDAVYSEEFIRIGAHDE